MFLQCNCGSCVAKHKHFKVKKQPLRNQLYLFFLFELACMRMRCLIWFCFDALSKSQYFKECGVTASSWIIYVLHCSCSSISPSPLFYVLEGRGCHLWLTFCCSTINRVKSQHVSLWHAPRGLIDDDNCQNAFLHTKFTFLYLDFRWDKEQENSHFSKKTVQLPWLFQRNFSSAEL